MPDVHGFNHLGNEVWCIEDGCPEGGRIWEWPERKRARHYLSHEKLRQRNAAKQRLAAKRELERIAAREANLERRVLGEVTP